MTLRTLNIQINVTSRRENYQGRPHLVVPATILTEGVRNGLYYPASELEKFVQAWNGVPVPVQHPQDENGDPIPANSPDVIEQAVVGTFFNAYYENGAIKGEIWLDEGRTKQVSPLVLDIINARNQILEVSTGLYLEEQGGSGTFDGDEYYTTAINYRPEHLALLPGGIGACSAKDGCGVRDNNDNNTKGGDVVPEKEDLIQQLADEEVQKDKNKFFGIFSKIAKKFDFQVQEVSHDEIRSQLQGIMDAKDVQPIEETTSGKYHYVRDVFDNYFVYTIYSEGETQMFKQNFNVNDDEEVELEGGPIEVRLKQEYVELEEELSKTGNNGGQGDEDAYVEINKKTDNNDKEVKCMACEEKVQALIDNEMTLFAEDDREYLMGLEDEVLDKMVPIAPKAPEIPDKTEIPEDNADDGIQDNEDTSAVDDEDQPITLEQVLDNSGEYKEMIEAGLKLHKEKKAKMVQDIMANKENKFSKEALESMDMDMLENLVALAGAKKDADYSLNKGETIRDNEDEEETVPDPPAMKWNQDGSPDFSHLN